MTKPPPASSSRDWVWALLLIALVAFRLPALVRPPGGDQHLYAYTAGRVLHGDVPYRDAWDQKPPGIFLVYAAAWVFWPDDHVIAWLDLAATIAAALLLRRLGREMFGGRSGDAAAAAYLLLADPGIQKLGGMYLRAQCETFIALAVTAAMVLAWQTARRPAAWLLCGALLAATFWLKYNAIVFALPVAIAVLWRDRLRESNSGPATRSSTPGVDLAWIVTGAIGTSLLVLGYFAVHGALTDLWIATITYNIQYSAQTYGSSVSPLTYLFTMPIARARVDGLWFLGLLGTLALLWIRRANRAAIVTLAWVAAAIISIVVNGARELPQYFLQATPALALAAGAGLASAWEERRRAPIVAIPVAALALIGLVRVGVEGPSPRLFGIPQAVVNVMDDVSYLRGATPRATYLDRFDRGEGGKYSPLAVERLAIRSNEIAAQGDRIYVFGFSGGGVLVKARRQSASRFFWSRPVVLEFESGRPGYGSAGLLADLTQNTPAVVALQKHDWGLATVYNEPDSIEFFMNQPQLRRWLEAGYTLDYEDAVYIVWRRKS